MFLHSAYHNREYSNNFVCILLLIALTSFAESALATKNWPKTAVLIPLTIAVAYLPSYHFLHAPPLLGLAAIWRLKRMCVRCCGKNLTYTIPAVIICFIIGRQYIIRRCPTMRPFLNWLKKRRMNLSAILWIIRGNRFQPIDYENFDLVHGHRRQMVCL